MMDSFDSSSFDVFHYRESDQMIECFREAICERVLQCISTGQPVNEFPEHMLYYGNWKFRMHPCRNVKSCLDELIWKRSELTGKYIGCPYWSIGAKAFFDSELAKLQSPVSLNGACNFAKRLSERRSKPKLTHEHVFPKRYLIPLLLGSDGGVKREEVETIIERLAIGCVVLESEHPKHDRARSNSENPWVRYGKDKIKLVDNPKWPVAQRNMIASCGLI